MRRTPKVIRVSRGYLTGEGATKTEAKAHLDRQIDWALKQSSPVIESRFGLLIVISATPNGFVSYVFNPADIPHSARQYSCTQHSQREYTDVLESARYHAAQIAWSLTVNDDTGHVERADLTESKARELARWIEFQRTYKAAKDAGHNDADAFSIASGCPLYAKRMQQGLAA